MLKQIIVLRKKKIDLIIDYELFMRIPSVIAYLIKAKSIAGFHKYELEGLYRGTYYDIKCSLNQNTHISKNLLALTKTAVKQVKQHLNLKEEIKTSEISVPKYKSIPNLRNILSDRVKHIYPEYKKNDLILVYPDVGGVLSVRNYPYYGEVIRKVLKKYPKSVVLILGVPKNMSICSKLHSSVNDKRCINFCGKTKNLKELVELINISKLYIGNDNGPAHFAALTDTKVLALFSTDTPTMYGPLGKCVVLYSHFHCSPCISAFNHKSSKCNNNLCLKSIPPEKVFKFASKLIDGDLNYRTVNNNYKYI